MSFVEIGFGFARYKAKIHEGSFAKTSKRSNCYGQTG